MTKRRWIHIPSDDEIEAIELPWSRGARRAKRKAAARLRAKAA